MSITILMPALSPTMTEGNLVKWLIAEGDTVVPGDLLAEIETDKATMEIEATDEGRVGRILVPGGSEGIAVNTPLAVLLEDGEDDSAIEAALAAVPAVPPPAAAPEASPAEATSPVPEPEPIPPAAPPPATAPSGGGGRIMASPLARRMAREKGLDLAQIRGSGPNGRIIKSDIEAAVAGGAAVAAVPGPAPGAPPSATPSAAPGAYEDVPLDGMRRIVAKRLVESKQTVPHFYLSIDCEIDALLDLRKQANAGPVAEVEGFKLSVNDFIIRASALALRKVPAANASFMADAIRYYGEVHVAVAVAIEGGLITPVVRNADTKGVAAISKEMRDLAARARERKLMPEEYQGGTFSISNLGMFGIREFAAVINPPQGAILAVGAGEPRPVVRHGAVAVATVMSCTLSCDHRVVDGAIGAQFLQEFKKLVEYPLSMML